MATFTMYLEEVLDSFGVDWSAANPDYSVIGLDVYPIFDETYRAGLNQKIVEHFLHWEIGLETPSLFKLNLRRKMNEVMPFYNQLYKSTWDELSQLDPFSTVKLDQINSGTSSDTSHNETSDTSSTNGSTNGTTQSGSRSVNSDFPQTALNGSGDYATSALDTNGTGSSSGTSATSETGSQTSDGTGSGSSNSTGSTSGYSGHTADLLIRYRQTFLNIDMELINNELGELFMGLWDNGDEYSRQAGMWFI